MQERMGAINAQVDDLEHRRSLLLQEARRQDEQVGVKNHIGNMRFNDEELSEVCEYLHDVRWCARAPTRWAARVAPPVAPDMDSQMTFNEALANLPVVDVQRPWWQGLVCSLREHMMSGVAISNSKKDLHVGVGEDASAEQRVVALAPQAPQAPWGRRGDPRVCTACRQRGGVRLLADAVPQ